MGEDEVIIALDKISDVQVKQGNEQTDAIIARVLNKSIETVQQDRINKAAKQTAERKALLQSMAADIWVYSGEEVPCFLSSAKVAAKAVQTMEWIANTWKGEPAAIASELLLIESDIKTIETMARKEEEHDKDGPIEVRTGNVTQRESRTYDDPLKHKETPDGLLS